MAVHSANGQLDGPGISRIAVTGFKSLASKADVEIRPLTVLAGANSSGKSSLMQPLLLMKQTLDNDRVPPGPFWLWGELARYTSADQFLSRGESPSEDPRRLVIRLELGEKWLELTLEKTAESDLALVGSASRSAKGRPIWRVQESMSSAAIEKMFDAAGMGFQSSALPEGTEFQVLPNRWFLPVGAKVGNGPINDYLPGEMRDFRIRVQEILHVSGLRGSYEREFYLHGLPSGGIFPGDFEEYVPSILDSWKGDSVREGSALEGLASVRSALQLLGISSDIQTRKLNESQIEVRIPRTLKSDAGDLVNVADVGLAVSQVLPVLVSLAIARPEQLLHVEQPELHLHPRAQWNLAQLLAGAANRGVRLVIETHSSILLRGILTQIAQNRISRDKVVLHWFERDGKTGLSTVHSKEPDPAGRVGDWPEDFGEVEMASNNDYLDAVESKLYAGQK